MARQADVGLLAELFGSLIYFKSDAIFVSGSLLVSPSYCCIWLLASCSTPFLAPNVTKCNVGVLICIEESSLFLGVFLAWCGALYFTAWFLLASSRPSLAPKASEWHLGHLGFGLLAADVLSNCSECRLVHLTREMAGSFGVKILKVTCLKIKHSIFTSGVVGMAAGW